ncbi:hypothetical protein [Microbispora sp. NPDC049125]|uniref:hypothetical protein n=1 Tax=Microbispora sp. NPDC049125 TaxID=3154929 RepID=UPI003465C024
MTITIPQAVLTAPVNHGPDGFQLAFLPELVCLPDDSDVRIDERRRWLAFQLAGRMFPGLQPREMLQATDDMVNYFLRGQLPK